MIFFIYAVIGMQVRLELLIWHFSKGQIWSPTELNYLSFDLKSKLEPWIFFVFFTEMTSNTFLLPDIWESRC